MSTPSRYYRPPLPHPLRSRLLPSFRPPITPPVDRTPEKKVMTIGLGFVYRDSSVNFIVFASDSRISIGTAITHEEAKIVEVPFADGYVMMAKAGYKIPYDRFQAIFSDKAKSTKIESANTVIGVAHEAIRELARELCDPTVIDRDQRIRDNYCEFIIGFHHGHTAYLYTMNLQNRIMAPVERFAVIGDGSDLAEFLLTGIDTKKMSVPSAFDLAIGVVDMCENHNSSCGTPCRVGILRDRTADDDEAPPPSILPDLQLKELQASALSKNEIHNLLIKKFSNWFKSSKL